MAEECLKLGDEEKDDWKKETRGKNLMDNKSGTCCNTHTAKMSQIRNTC